jgi:aminopeptidase N
MLLEELLGDDNFVKATREFIKLWNGKHPSPYDFFNTFSRFAPEDINWFWKACYFDYGYADLGIKSVDKKRIIIERKGNIPISIKLEITYDDNSQEKIYRNLNVWKTGIIQYPIELKTGKNIQKIKLGDNLTPDVDNSDNVYQR